MSIFFRYSIILLLLVIFHCQTTVKIHRIKLNKEKNISSKEIKEQLSSKKNKKNIVSSKKNTIEKNKDQKKNRKISKKFYYSASKLKSVFKYHPYYNNGKKKGWVTYIYNAKIIHGDTILKAPVFELLGKNQNVIYANHSIYYYDKETKTTLTAGKAKYIKASEKLYLFENPKIIKKLNSKKSKIEEKIVITSKTMIRDSKSKISIAKDDVTILKDKIKIICGMSIFEERKNTLHFTINPKVESENNSIVSQKIDYYLKQKKIVFQNKIKIIIYDNKQTHTPKKNNNIHLGNKTTIWAGYAEFFMDTNRINIKRSHIITKNYHPVKIRNTKIESNSDNVTILGKKLDNIILKNNAIVHFKKDNIFIKSGFINIDYLNKKIITKEFAQQKPHIFFSNNKNKIQAFVNSNFFQIINKKNDIKQIQAIGEVNIHLLKKKNFIDSSKKTFMNKLKNKNFKVLKKSISIHGQWLEGTLNESFQIFGQPSVIINPNSLLQKAKSSKKRLKEKRIFFKRILYFPKENRSIWYGKIKGKI